MTFAFAFCKIQTTMSQLQTLDQQILARKQMKAQARKRSVSDILSESAAEAKRQGIKLKDVLLELEKVRQEFYEKYYA